MEADQQILRILSNTDMVDAREGFVRGDANTKIAAIPRYLALHEREDQRPTLSRTKSSILSIP